MQLFTFLGVLFWKTVGGVLLTRYHSGVILTYTTQPLAEQVNPRTDGQPSLRCCADTVCSAPGSGH